MLSQDECGRLMDALNAAPGGQAGRLTAAARARIFAALDAGGVNDWEAARLVVVVPGRTLFSVLCDYSFARVPLSGAAPEPSVVLDALEAAVAAEAGQ